MTWLVPVGAATGLVLVLWGIGSPGSRFADRLTPYVDPRRASSTALKVFLARLSPRSDPSRRLVAAGRFGEPRAFVVQGLAWAFVGGVCLAALTTPRTIGSAGVVAVVGAFCGWLSRDKWLVHQIARRDRTMRQDLPTALDLMSIAMVAGEGVVGALSRAEEHLTGPVSEELGETLRCIRSGTPVAEALVELEARCSEPAMSRFADALVIALDRGSPVAETLHAHARDLREEERRWLLEAGGRREIAMLLPIVFLILPVIVVFVLYPGLVSLEMLVR